MSRARFSQVFSKISRQSYLVERSPESCCVTLKFDFALLFAGLCTHIIYSFAGLDTDTSKIKSLDPWLDLGDGGSTGRRTFLLTTELKRRNPELKVSLAIGGWNEGSEKYSKMAADPAKRAIFVKSVLKMLRDYNFDGFDLDWEYPGMTDAARLIKVKGNACFYTLTATYISRDVIEPKGFFGKALHLH